MPSDEKIIKSNKKGKSPLTDLNLFVTGSIDIPFLAITIALLTIGLIMLFSASYPYAFSYRKKQSVRLSIYPLMQALVHPAFQLQGQVSYNNG